MPTAIKHKDKLLYIRKPTRDELRAFERMQPSKTYGRYLGLVINERMTVNQFTGKVKELQELVAQIKEAVL